ncbi:MAG TPA: hypothetical protein VGD60_11400 [Candidatus Acidoferrales bacterium]
MSRAAHSRAIAFPVFLALLCCCLLASQVAAQEVAKRFTNQDVIDMVGLGMSDDVIIAKIRSVSAANGLKFDTSVDALKALKAAKVSDEVIKMMLNPNPVAATVYVAPGSAVSNDPNLPPPEVGVYWKDGANFVLLQGMAVSQVKAGGRAGSFFTDGMRSEHWDATIAGPTSLNRVKERAPVFYFYVPDGDTAADYVLLKLERKSDHREFQVGNFGGITGGKSGVKKDKQIPFRAEHVGIRVYRVSLEADLKVGEYAFFLGTGSQANMSGGNIGSARSGGAAGGRVYDFAIPE